MPGKVNRKGVPQDLEQQTRDRFEKLHAEGQILWQPFLGENAEDQGFKVQFQTATHLVHKPINPIGSKGEKHSNGSNPFANPDPAFVVAYPGPDHTLILNKFPVYKDSLIIHTNEFQPQSDDMNQSDMAACWNSLQALYSESSSEDRQWIMIYNCGSQAGSSQGHKHMQFWPVPSAAELGFEVFANRAESSTEIVSVPNIPFKHFIFKLSPHADVLEVWTAYTRLLSEVKRVHKQYGSTAYNVAMASEWLMLVPRRSSGGKWGFGGNTAVVLGLLWVSSPQEKRLWDEYGICKHLARLGVPT